MGDFVDTTVSRIAIGNPAAAANEAVRKGELDAALAQKSGTSHTHAQLHDAASIAAGNKTLALTIAGQEIAGEVRLAASSALEITNDGLKVSLGIGAAQAKPGDWQPENDHAAATGGETPTATVTVTGQAVTADVKLASNGALKTAEGGGVAVDIGTGATQASAGNHTHPVVTSDAPGLMSSAQLAQLNAATAAQVVSVQDTATVDLNKDGAGKITASVIPGSGLKTGTGLEVNFNVVAKKTHDHPTVGGIDVFTITNPGEYTVAPTVEIAGDGEDAEVSVTLLAVSIGIAEPGAGYAVNNQLYAVGGASTQGLAIKVTSVDGNGGITGASIVTAGAYTQIPPDLQIPLAYGTSGTSGTAGSAGYITATWGAGNPNIVKRGHGYTSASATFSAGSAAATVTVGTKDGFASASDIASVWDHETRLDGHDADIAALDKKVSGNLVPYGAVYTLATYTLEVVEGRIYEYTPGENETGFQPGPVEGGIFTALNSNATFYGTIGLPVTAVLRDVTSEQKAITATSEIVAKAPLPVTSSSIQWNWGTLSTAGFLIMDAGTSYLPQAVVFDPVTGKFYCAVQVSGGYFPVTDLSRWAECKAAYDASAWTNQDYTEVGTQVHYTDGKNYQLHTPTTDSQPPTDPNFWGELVVFAPSSAEVRLHPNGGLEMEDDGMLIAVQTAKRVLISSNLGRVATDDSLEFDPDAKTLAADATAFKSEQVVNLQSNNLAIVPTKELIKFSSDDTTATNRVFRIADPPRPGFKLTIYWSGTNAGKLVNNSSEGTRHVRLFGDWTPNEHGSITLIDNGTDWIEKCRQGVPSNDLSAISANGVVVRTGAGAFAARNITSVDESLVITNPTGAAGDIDIKIAPAGVQTIEYGTNIVVDFNGEPFQTIFVTGDLSISTINRGPGKSVSLRLIADASPRALTIAAGIRALGTKPTSLAANKLAMCSLTSFGANESDTVMAFGVEA